MDTFVDERDFKILEADKYTFFVLSRIMTRECELLLSDHSRMIICYSTSPFPVWIWTINGATEDEMENTYKLADQHGFPPQALRRKSCLPGYKSCSRLRLHSNALHRCRLSSGFEPAWIETEARECEDKKFEK